MPEAWLEEVRWDHSGRVPALTLDHGTERLLGLGWMNRQSLILSIARGRAVYCDRQGMGTLDPAGETGGTTLRIREIRSNRDRDAIVLRVVVEGVAAGRPARIDGWRLLEARWQPDADGFGRSDTPD